VTQKTLAGGGDIRYLPPMTILTNSKDVKALCQRLGTAEFITVDTEFLRESTYWPQLCLIQVAGPDEAACIDPLAPDMDLKPFFDLLMNPAIVKVFHAARQDLEIFDKMMNKLPEPIFDTQVAAMVCGYGDSVGYDNLINQMTGILIDKSSRFTDWSRRPLTEKQIEYALADVTHLRVAYTKLRAMLAENGRAAWLAEEMAVLNDTKTYRVNPNDAWLRIKPRTTKPKFLAILKEVAAWREKEAQARDLPRGRVIRDEAIEEIAAHPPSNVEELSRIRSLSKGWADGKMGQGLLKAVAKGVATAPEDAPKMPPKPQLGSYSHALVELLKVLLRHICDEANVAPRLIATISDLEMIAASDKADTPALIGWRRELFGEQALALKQGRLALAATKKGKVRLIALEEEKKA
jgi:ribonuclease D